MWPVVRRKWVKGLLLLYPIATVFCIVVTGNHYWMDAVGGLVVLGAGYTLGTFFDNWYHGFVLPRRRRVARRRDAIHAVSRQREDRHRPTGCAQVHRRGEREFLVAPAEPCRAVEVHGGLAGAHDVGPPRPGVVRPTRETRGEDAGD